MIINNINKYIYCTIYKVYIYNSLYNTTMNYKSLKSLYF